MQSEGSHRQCWWPWWAGPGLWPALVERCPPGPFWGFVGVLFPAVPCGCQPAGRRWEASVCLARGPSHTHPSRENPPRAHVSITRFKAHRRPVICVPLPFHGARNIFPQKHCLTCVRTAFDSQKIGADRAEKSQTPHPTPAPLLLTSCISYRKHTSISALFLTPDFLSFSLIPFPCPSVPSRSVLHMQSP